jgi:hypothetical protein
MGASSKAAVDDDCELAEKVAGVCTLLKWMGPEKGSGRAPLLELRGALGMLSAERC